MLETRITQQPTLMDNWESTQIKSQYPSMLKHALRTLHRVTFNTVWYASLILGLALLACKTSAMLLS